MKEAIHTDRAPAAIGPYSQAVRAGGFLFTSGQIPVDPAAGDIPAGIKAQAQQSLNNIAAILAQAGLDRSAVVKTTVFLKDMNDFAAMNEVYPPILPAPRWRWPVCPRMYWWRSRPWPCCKGTECTEKALGRPACPAPGALRVQRQGPLWPRRTHLPGGGPPALPTGTRQAAPHNGGPSPPRGKTAGVGPEALARQRKIRYNNRH